jgi:phosphoglycolate phosphatase
MTVIFDLDGTLVDTAPDLVASLNVAFGEAGLGPVEFEALRPFVNHGARQMIEAGLRLNQVAIEGARVDDLLDRLREDYWAHIDRFSRPYDGVLELLERLDAAGTVLGVCTNKREAPSIELLTRLGMLEYFCVVLGGDRVPAPKPDPAHLIQTITQAGGDAGRCVMVGDSATDVKTARAARIPVIVVDFGYACEPPETLGADLLVSHHREIPAALTRLMGQRPVPGRVNTC